MTVTYLKWGKPAAERAQDDAKVRATVEAALLSIEQRGDAAVREMAESFDGYSRESYRLSDEEIRSIIARVSGS